MTTPFPDPYGTTPYAGTTEPVPSTTTQSATVVGATASIIVAAPNGTAAGLGTVQANVAGLTATIAVAAPLGAVSAPGQTPFNPGPIEFDVPVQVSAFNALTNFGASDVSADLEVSARLELLLSLSGEVQVDVEPAATKFVADQSLGTATTDLDFEVSASKFTLVQSFSTADVDLDAQFSASAFNASQDFNVPPEIDLDLRVAAYLVTAIDIGGRPIEADVQLDGRLELNISLGATDVDADVQLSASAFQNTTSAIDPVDYTITSYSVTNNVVTITTSAAHGYVVGQTVTMTGLGEPYDGTYTITAVTGTTFSYKLLASETSVDKPATTPTTTSTVTETPSVTTTGATATYSGTTVTVVANSPTTYVVGQTIVVSGMGYPYDGTYVVTSVSADGLSYTYELAAPVKSFTPNIYRYDAATGTATLEFGSGVSTHGYVVGQYITISGMGPPYDGTYLITAVESNGTIRFAASWGSSNISAFVPAGATTTAAGSSTGGTITSTQPADATKPAEVNFDVQVSATLGTAADAVPAGTTIGYKVTPDMFADAVELVVPSKGQISLSNMGAGTQAGEPRHPYKIAVVASIWLKFTITETTYVHTYVEGRSPTNQYADYVGAYQEIYKGTTIDTLELVDFAPRSWAYYLEHPRQELMTPGTYYIRITTERDPDPGTYAPNAASYPHTTTVTFQWEIAAKPATGWPAYGLLETPLAITGGSGEVSVTTNTQSRHAWVQWTAPTSGLYRFYVEGQSLAEDVYIAIFGPGEINISNVVPSGPTKGKVNRKGPLVSYGDDLRLGATAGAAWLRATAGTTYRMRLSRYGVSDDIEGNEPWHWLAVTTIKLSWADTQAPFSRKGTIVHYNSHSANDDPADRGYVADRIASSQFAMAIRERTYTEEGRSWYNPNDSGLATNQQVILMNPSTNTVIAKHLLPVADDAQAYRAYSFNTFAMSPTKIGFLGERGHGTSSDGFIVGVADASGALRYATYAMQERNYHYATYNAETNEAVYYAQGTANITSTTNGWTGRHSTLYLRYVNMTTLGVVRDVEYLLPGIRSMIPSANGPDRCYMMSSEGIRDMKDNLIVPFTEPAPNAFLTSPPQQAPGVKANPTTDDVYAHQFHYTYANKITYEDGSTFEYGVSNIDMRYTMQTTKAAKNPIHLLQHVGGQNIFADGGVQIEANIGWWYAEAGPDLVVGAGGRNNGYGVEMTPVNSWTGYMEFIKADGKSYVENICHPMSDVVDYMDWFGYDTNENYIAGWVSVSADGWVMYTTELAIYDYTRVSYDNARLSDDPTYFDGHDAFGYFISSTFFKLEQLAEWVTGYVAWQPYQQLPWQ